MIDQQIPIDMIVSALREDIGDGDHSTLSCIDATVKGKAVLKIKEDCVMAGIDIAATIFKLLDAESNFMAYKKDGDVVLKGEVAFEIHATVHAILKGERLVLNTMQRMSGIATLTRKYVDKLSGSHTRLLDTRKTTPNFRWFEKKAVLIGGGCNHRMGLYDMIMLKDNHIDYCGGLEQAIGKAVDYVKHVQPQLKIEVETRNLEDVKKVMDIGGIQRIMLDNFTPDDLKVAVEMIGGKYETEASGGITIDNIEDYARSGVDFISCGAIIHHAVSVDLSLKATIA